jgi:putative transposase
MPWAETKTMDLRVCFIAACLRAEEPMSRLCERYGISRKTGYKWLERYQAGGTLGLEDRSSAPHVSPHRIAPEAAEQLLALRKLRPHWGPLKLLAILKDRAPEMVWPAASTVGDLLRREGYVTPRQRCCKKSSGGGPVVFPDSANDSWAADFKGWFRTKDGTRCDPLTISDGFSRYLLVCHAVPQLTFDAIQPLFETAFRDNGLPKAIRTDNGSPFAARRGLAGLSRLSVWFLKLGIWPDHIAPGRPDQNGRHERFHRTLAEETASPPALTLAEQQDRFDTWRQDYNAHRPHQALGQKCPAGFYCSSPRPFPVKIADWDYPADHHIRRISADGYLRWQDQKLYLSEALRGENVAIAQQDDGNWWIRFREFDLAVLENISGKVVRSQLARSDKPETNPKTVT